MTLHELGSTDEVKSFQTTNPNTLICFSATWCGPCVQSKPQLQELASSYASDPSLDVKVGIVYEHNLGDDIHQFRISAFPTYVLFGGNGMEKGRVEGVNFDGIRQMVATAGCKKDLGEGYSLGGGGAAVSAEEARAQRLAKFQKLEPKSTPIEASAEPKQEMKPESASKEAMVEAKPDVEMTDATEEAKEGTTTTEMVDPTTSLPKEHIETLTGAMGFSLIRAQKGLLKSTTGVEGAIEWLLEHQDDADIDDPIPLVPNTEVTDSGGAGGMVAKSYKCNECGKILASMADLELHANKTGHTDFEELTTAVKPLTPEEKAAKVLEIKALLKAKRAEREEAEKVDNVDREKQRRFMGKEMGKTKEQMDIEKRKRDAMMRKREKEESKRERERIRRELEKDKLERRAHKGKLTSKLGVDGYHPDGIQYDVNTGENIDDAKPKPKVKPSAAKIDEYISKVASYRAGGDGGKCLKILLAIVKKVVENPNEDKFKSVSMESKVYKGKIKPFVGAKNLLLAVGFNPNEQGEHLVLGGDADMEVLSSTKDKLEAAFAAY